MSKTQLMTNKDVLLASGVTEEQYNTVMNADAQVAVGTLSPIHKTLMSFVSEQRIMWADLRDPLKELEQSYASLNGGDLNGMFQETLIPPDPKGDDGLYGGVAYNPSTIPDGLQNPWENIKMGNKPIQYTYGINEKIRRHVDWDEADFLMQLKRYSLIDYTRSHQQILRANANGTAYVLKNKVLNCEKFQYLPYAECPVFNDPELLGEFMQKVYTDQAFPEANMQWKKTKFNTTRGNGELVFVLNKDFFYKYAQNFQFDSYLKPFIYRYQDANRFGTTAERSRIILVDALTPTTLGENEILVPRALQPATLPEGSELVGRIVDMNAVKFGVGLLTSREMPLDDRVMHYIETQDYCLNMCDAYVDVPILVNSNMDTHRKIYVINTPTAAEGD